MWFTRSKDDSTSTIHLGANAEAIAEQYLQQQGLKTRYKNFRTKLGELDLVMQHDQCIVFVEVRLRTNPRFSSAAETVDYRKQQKMLKTAQAFLQHHQLVDKVPCRFDVIAIHNPTDLNKIEWIQNAFDA